MKKVVYTLLFFSWLALTPAFTQTQKEHNIPAEQLFKELTVQDLQAVISYLYDSGHFLTNSYEETLLCSAQSLLRLKTQKLSEDDSHLADCQASSSIEQYRIRHLAQILEEALGRKVYLNQDNAFVVSNATPIVYQDQGRNFSLKTQDLPNLDSTLKEGPILKVFEQSIQYPDYSVLYWSPTHQEYAVYSIEYQTFFRASHLSQLSDEQIIVLFGKLFPLSLQKPAWAWKVFGLTSIKREISALFSKENKAHHL